VDMGLDVGVTYYLRDVKKIDAELIPQAVSEPSPPPDKKLSPVSYLTGEYIEQKDYDLEKSRDEFLLYEFNKQLATSSPPQNTQKVKRPYFERQLEKQVLIFKTELNKLVDAYKRLYHVIAEKGHWMIEDAQQWPLVKNPPPRSSWIIFLFLCYILICFPLMRIANTLSSHSWMAWIPILQVVLLLRITERPLWQALILLVPIINIFFLIILFREICDMLGQEPYLGILIIFPILNIFLLWYLANVELSNLVE